MFHSKSLSPFSCFFFILFKSRFFPFSFLGIILSFPFLLIFLFFPLIYPSHFVPTLSYLPLLFFRLVPVFPFLSSPFPLLFSCDHFRLLFPLECVSILSKDIQFSSVKLFCLLLLLALPPLHLVLSHISQSFLFIVSSVFLFYPLLFSFILVFNKSESFLRLPRPLPVTSPLRLSLYPFPFLLSFVL